MMQCPPTNNSLGFLAAKETGFSPKVLGKLGSGWRGQRELALEPPPQYRVQQRNVGLPSHLLQAACQDVSVSDSQQQSYTTLHHAHFQTHTHCLCSSDSNDFCWVTLAARVCRGWVAE